MVIKKDVRSYFERFYRSDSLLYAGRIKAWGGGHLAVYQVEAYSQAEGRIGSNIVQGESNEEKEI